MNWQPRDTFVYFTSYADSFDYIYFSLCFHPHCEVNPSKLLGIFWSTGSSNYKIHVHRKRVYLTKKIHICFEVEILCITGELLDC